MRRVLRVLAFAPVCCSPAPFFWPACEHSSERNSVAAGPQSAPATPAAADGTKRTLKFGEKLLQRAGSASDVVYVDYERLRAAIALAVKAASADEAAELFFSQVSAELAKINQYFTQRRDKLTSDLNNLSLALAAAPASADAPSPAADSDAVQLVNDIDAFMEWVSLNYTALTRIVEKYDRKTGQTELDAFCANVLDRQPFCEQSLVELASLGAACRLRMGLVPAHEDASSAAAAAGAAAAAAAAAARRPTQIGLREREAQ